MLKAIASRSTNFSLTNALWMKDNYVVTAGLTNNGEDGKAQQPATAEIEAAEGDEQAGQEAGETPSDAPEEAPAAQTDEDMNTL